MMEQLRQQRTLLQSVSSQRDEVVAKDTLASLEYTRTFVFVESITVYTRHGQTVVREPYVAREPL